MCNDADCCLIKVITTYCNTCLCLDPTDNA
jgi:hypothetical protein